MLLWSVVLIQGKRLLAAAAHLRSCAPDARLCLSIFQVVNSFLRVTGMAQVKTHDHPHTIFHQLGSGAHGAGPC